MNFILQQVAKFVFLSLHFCGWYVDCTRCKPSVHHKIFETVCHILYTIECGMQVMSFIQSLCTTGCREGVRVGGGSGEITHSTHGGQNDSSNIVKVVLVSYLCFIVNLGCFFCQVTVNCRSTPSPFQSSVVL